MDQEENKEISFDLPKNRSNVIKVMGVGGGGSNAINYMFQQGIKGVDFIISNTDAQALSESGVPTKIQLGASLTEGLGAGANPEVGAKAAQESQDEIHSILATQTKMIFITAGMGGGTGTGAAPIIAQMAKSMDILTVGIVTMPFQFEGKLRLEQAQKGLEKIREAVDALIVINNNKLREVYGNLGFKAGFAKADEVLATAARGIAEVITHHYTQNIDLKDAKTVLTNSGTAIMGSGTASGSNRAQEAIVKALDSPLLNDNKITGCKNVLLLIVSGSDEITIDEIGEINDYIQAEAGNHTNIIMGVGEDESLGNEVSVTVIATGFGIEQQNEISNTEAKKIIHSLDDEQKIVHDLSDTAGSDENLGLETFESPEEEQIKASYLEKSKELENPFIQTTALLRDIEFSYEEVVAEPSILSEPAPTLLEVEEFEKQDIDEDSHLESDFFNPAAELELTDELLSLDPEGGVTENEIPLAEAEDENLTEEEVEEAVDFELASTFFESQKEDQSEELMSENTTVGLETEEEVGAEEFDFIFNEIETKDHLELEVIDPEEVRAESQIEMEFDQPLPTKSESQPLPIRNEEVPEFQKEKTTTKDFDEAALEVKFELKTEEKPTAAPKKTEVSESLDTAPPPLAEANPFDQSIDQTLAAQNEKRKEHLKAFNHRFMHQMQRVDEFEKQPAYKRKGLDLEEDVSEAPSRTSLDTDSNDDLQLRSNNSFLHDNVD